MTSHTGVHALWRELHFGAAPPPGAERRGGIAFTLDFDTPTTWPDMAYDTATPAARYDAKSRAHLAAVLDAAAHTLAMQVPAAWNLVDRELQRVLLRRCDGSPGTSTSHRAHVGACLLTNLHQPADAVPLAVEALVHEAIHQRLYRTEAADGAFCDLAEMPNFRSPWTGARLPLHSLVHASFVWFGLLTLWTTLALRPATGAQDALGAHARQRMAHCLFGFAFLGDVLDSPAFPLASLQPQVLQVLRAMTTATLQATRAAEPGATLRQQAAARDGAGWPAALAGAMALQRR